MIPKLEDCKPGLRPMGYNVLVAVDVVQEKSAGGIILPGAHRAGKQRLGKGPHCRSVADGIHGRRLGWRQ